jgi:hypothetical protein
MLSSTGSLKLVKHAILVSCVKHHAQMSKGDLIINMLSNLVKAPLKCGIEIRDPK